jgi:hypothetical protein
LSQFESAAEISLGLHEAEIAEAKRLMDKQAAEEAALAELEAQRDAEAIMPAATPEKPKLVPPAQPRQLPPAPTKLPTRNFYETLRRYFDEETGVKTLKQAFLEIVPPEPSSGDVVAVSSKADDALAEADKTSEDLLLLNVDQLRQLVQEAAPDASAREMRHFEVMTLPGGDGVAIEDVRVTLADLRAAIRGSQRAHKAARFRASALGSAPHSEKYDEKVQSAVPPAKLTGGMQDVLERMRSSLEEEQIPTRAIFEAFDSDKDGKLDASEVKDMVWRLLPTLEPDQVRMALAHIFEHASFEENEISFSDFAADAIAAGEDPGKKRGTVSFRTFDTAIKALQLGREEEDS